MNEFVEKVRIEREVLNVVNSFIGEPQLCGLAAISIENWRLSHTDCSQTVIECLRELSRLVGALCDRSGERFDAEAHINSISITTVLERLKGLLSNYK